MLRDSSTKARVKSPVLNVARYRGQWVAVHPRTYKVVGHGSTPMEAEKTAADYKRVKPLIYYVPKTDAFFVGQAK
jgi:hypothetical protein